MSSLAWARGDGVPRHWRRLAALWLLVCAAVAVHQWQFWHAAQFDADVLSLLPQDEQAPAVSAATAHLAAQAARRVVVLLGAPDWPAARRAAQAWRSVLAQADPALQPRALADEASLAEALAFYRPWRDRLLTDTQRARLSSTSGAALGQEALAALYRPAGAAGTTTNWTDDPLSLWTTWWAERAGATRARWRDSELWLEEGGRQWIVLTYEAQGPAFRMDGLATHADALADAQAAARREVPDLRVVAAGVPLHAEAAAVRANAEVNVIGWGSLAAVLLLVGLAFRAVRPILLVALSLVVGVAAALSVTALVFGQVHLLTLIFGASLVGVAEDYGIHWFAARQAHPGVEPTAMMRRLLPGLGLAFATSALAYAALGVAPFPGLRQMAVFSATGLLAAFLTVVCWYPWLDRRPVRATPFARRIACSLEAWPRWAHGGRAAVLAVMAVVFAAGLSFRLPVSDDLRQLQSSPVALVQAEREAARLLSLPSPGQFFLVEADSDDVVLEREEALKTRLAALVADGRLGGWHAVSDWVPSAARQATDAELTARVERGAIDVVNTALGEQLARPGFAAQPLSLAAWLASPAAGAARALWVGDRLGRPASVVMLRSVRDPGVLPALAASTQGLPGVRWVDKAADIGALLGRYRVAMTELLVAAHVLVLCALALRFGRAAWRAWLPAVVASLAAVWVAAAVGQPLQLFHVLALLLLLGVGVDYGIFLLEHEGDGSAWLAVVLGAGSTWIGFGMLGLSSTPALRAFGLTLLVGVAVVWLVAPCLRPPPRSSSS